MSLWDNAMITGEDILQKVREAGAIRPRELEAQGISRKHLQRLYEQGLLHRSGRGVYVLAEGDFTENQTLLEAAKRVPEGVICLLSALRFHDLTTQNPFEVWIALPPRSWHPRGDYPPLRVVTMSGPAFTEGAEEHPVGGATLRVFSPAKTVADCFKYRNKIGLDVALEALRDYRRKFRGGTDELTRYARICRVERVMRPYLEALV
jgi:predicted transcriptional regulator of viral defense system